MKGTVLLGKEYAAFKSQSKKVEGILIHVEIEGNFYGAETLFELKTNLRSKVQETTSNLPFFIDDNGKYPPFIHGIILDELYLHSCPAAGVYDLNLGKYIVCQSRSPNIEIGSCWYI